MKKFILIGIFIVVSLSAYLTGCSAKKETVGQPLSNAVISSAKDVLTKADQFQGKTVKVEGQIIAECPAGGWFHVKDKTGVVYVNLHPSELAIPQAVGRTVVAEGVLRKEGTQVEIIGKGVELK